MLCFVERITMSSKRGHWLVHRRIGRESCHCLEKDWLALASRSGVDLLPVEPAVCDFQAAASNN